MRRVVRLSPAVVSLFAAAGLIIAGLAWACVPTAELSVDPRFGPAGSQVTVHGSSFGDRTVEIRWNSQTGPLLARAQGPTFSTSVTIPASAAGVRVLKAVAYDADGAVAGAAGVPFEVTSTAPAPRAPQAPALARPPVAMPSPAAPVVGRTPAARAPENSGERGRGERGPAEGRVPSRSAGGAPQPVGAVRRTTQTFFAGSVPAVRPLAPSFARQAPTSPSRTSRGTFGRAAAVDPDVWSGFSSGSAYGLGANRAPASAPGGELTAGLVLLGLGLIALVAGVGLGLSRRRSDSARISS